MSSSPRSLEGKVALVTGVSAGLGRAIVTQFLSAGASVVGAARRAAEGAELARELGTERFAFEQADVARVADCERLVAATLRRFGRIDVLVNNAAVRPDPPLMSLHDTDEETWDRVCDTNLKGPFFLTKFALGPMRAQRSGLILSIASNTAEIAVRQMSVYATSKAGLAHLMRATAVEYFEEGIRANAILLGGTATGQQNRTAAAKRAAIAEPRGGQAPLYDPTDVARTLVLLASDDASTLTGASIAIDHGATAGAWASAFVHQSMTNVND